MVDRDGVDGVDERQPVEFPLTFDEWVAEQPAMWAVVLAGFRFRVRQAGQLCTPRTRQDWTGDFAAYRNAVV
jgi:hypothetical protein